MLEKLLNQKTRAYIYRVLLTLAPIAVAHGLLSDSEIGLWIASAEALLGLGLATRFTNLGDVADSEDPSA